MVKKQFSLVLFSIILVLAFLVVRPFIKAILFAAILAYIFFPLNKWLRKKFKNKNCAATLTLLAIILIALIPTVFTAKTLIEESYSSYVIAKQKLSGFEICENGGFLCDTWNDFENDFLGEDFPTFIKSNVEKISNSAVSGLYGFVKGIADSILNVFVFLFLTFFLLRDGEGLSERIYALMPLSKKERKISLKEIKELIHAVVFGSIIIAIVQGAFAALGFAIFGVNAPLLWGLLVVFAAFVPFVGATLVWLPVALIYLGDAILGSDVGMIWKGIGLLLYGTFVISGVDNVLKPKLIGDRSRLHPAMVFLGAIGGVYLLGPVGVFIGPVIMALLVTFLRIYEEYKMSMP